MAVNKRAAGADKEQLAARYLVDNGYTVLERNFRNKTGEIDIIAKKDNYIVFVEVKYRSNNKYLLPFSTLPAEIYRSPIFCIQLPLRVYL